MKSIRRCFLAVILLFACLQTSVGQIIFSHTMGLTYSSYFNASSMGILYSPRILLFHTGKESNISLGTHLGGGFAWHSFLSEKTYYYEAPLVFEYNFGQGSEPNTRSKTGGFIGIGAGVNRSGSEKAWGIEEYNAAGMIFTVGIRKTIKDIPLGLRISYLYNFSNPDYNVWGVGFYYVFGEL